MSDQLHTIKFRRNGVEFELTGSEADVQKAWISLEPSVVAAFAHATNSKPKAPSGTPSEQEASGAEPASKPRKHQPRRSAEAKAADGRQDIVDKLLRAEFDTFPEMPDDAKALYTGLATLQWARDTLGIDGLMISEIHAFLSKKLRFGQTKEAYRLAFKELPRATNATGSPMVYRLMRPGDQALEAYLKKRAAGASEADAEKAGAEAEESA